MPTSHPQAILSVTVTQIREEIAEYERILATIPRSPELPDNELARAVLNKLIRERHALLGNFDRLAAHMEHGIECLPTGVFGDKSLTSHHP